MNLKIQTMKKILPQVFFILAILLLLLKLVFSIYSRYDLFTGMDSWKYLSPYLLSGHLIDLGVTGLAIAALVWHTPGGYLMFMIAPFHLWTSAFMRGFEGHWIGILLYGLIIPLVFNLNFIRHLYLKQPNLWCSKFLWAMGIGIILGLFPLLFR